MNFFKELSKGKLAGHPIHVMVIHFPLALFPVSFLFDLVYYKSGDPAFSVMSFYCMAIGLGGSYVAAIFGIIDLLNIGKDTEILKKALIHAGITTTVVFCYTILVALRYKHIDFTGASPRLFMGLNLFLNIILIVGAHYGGDLIFRHKVGVKE
jgi:uncharacterized membrane protein